MASVAEHWTSGWFCLECKRPRALADFGNPCVCGALPMACDERHTVPHDAWTGEPDQNSLDALADRVRTEQEDRPERERDQQQHDVLEGQVHGPTIPPQADA